MKHRVLSFLPGLTAGLAIGWLDVGASAVQGTLLLLMVAAFGLALITRTPAWQIALMAAAGFLLAHVAPAALGRGGDLQFGMLIVVVPLLAAAFGGRMVAGLIADASATIDGPGAASTSVLTTTQILAIALIACIKVGFVPVYATLVARGQPNAWWVAMIWQIITFVAWAAATPRVIAYWRTTRASSREGVEFKELVLHASIVFAVACVHAVFLTLATRALFIPLGNASVLEAIEWAGAAYLPMDALTYCLIVGLAHAYDAGRKLRAAASREAAARGELATSRLSSLQAQLRPHFLFNALNAASVLAKRGDERASVVLTKLSELLRYVLREPQTVHLDDELQFIDAYLSIEHERFADRLRPTIDADADARAALVPHLVLQPLVENAIHHGIAAKVAAGEVRVSALHRGTELVLTVEDDGPGVFALAPGIGLANTRSRLATLYGDKARLELESRENGGAIATIVIPYER